MSEGKLCKPCGVRQQENENRQWWSLNNYYGFTGWFCPDCYNKVSHRNGEPENPAEYVTMLLKKDFQGVKR
jgi:hypothetical protein